MQLLHRIILIFILADAARTDIVCRRISNRTIAAGMIAEAAAYIIEPLRLTGTEWISMILPAAGSLWLFHMHMLGAGDVKLFGFVLFATPNDGVRILLTGLCIAAVYSLYRLIEKKRWKKRLRYLCRWVSGCSAGKNAYYPVVCDSTEITVPLAFFILAGACICTLAG